MIDRTIKVALGSEGVPPLVKITQGDTQWRFAFQVYLNNQRYTIPSGSSAILSGRKPDGLAVELTGSISGNVVYVSCTSQFTAVSGLVPCTLQLFDASGLLVNSCPVLFACAPDAKGGAEVSASDLSAYEELLASVQQLLADYNAAGAVPGYVSAWLAENITNPDSPPVDASLTVTGAAADAKAAGDWISPLYFDSNDESLWTVGAISSSTGANSTSTTRLRTAGYIGADCKKITVNSGYKYMIFGYSDGAYMGTWDGTSFVKSGNWRTTETDLTAIPGGYAYRLVMAYSNDGPITTDAATHLTMASTTDSSLTLGGRAPDSAVVGEMLKTALSLTVGDMRMTTLANGTDLNDLTTPGNYRTLSAAGARTILNCPVSSAFRLTVSFVYGAQATYQEIRTATGSTYYRSLNSGSWSAWRILSFRLYPTADSTEDRTSAILSSLNFHKICELPQGTFTVEGLNMPADSTIRGAGRGTILQLPAGSTSYAIKMAKGCTIENVKIVGTGGEGWIPDVEANGSDGILINVEGDDEAGRNRMNISNIEVCGFTGAGIKLISTGVNYDNTVNIVNTYIHNNNYGIDCQKNSEYNRISNCSIARNVVGIRMNGGNNLVSNCGINGNTTGILMDTTGITGANNNSHGTFSCCNINHSHTFESSSATTAIKIVGMQSGEVFTGCQIAYGGIDIQSSIGINFNACNFLSDVPIAVSGSGFSMFTCCIFQQTSASPVTKTGTGVLLFRECYVRSGAAFNPI